MKQRKTQTQAYWATKFQLSPNDVNDIYQEIADQHKVVRSSQVALKFIEQHCAAEEQALLRLQDGQPYQPQNHYEVGDTILLDDAIGTVDYVREGRHPQFEDFSVIGVSFKNGFIKREFIAAFKDTGLLTMGEQLAGDEAETLLAPSDIYARYSSTIDHRIQLALSQNKEFISFNNQYYLQDLLTDFYEGLYNIADAAIDINQGPLDTATLVQQLDLTKKEVSDELGFMVNYHLQQDARFIDVGPTDQTLWYLKRLQPDYAAQPIASLHPAETGYATINFDSDLRALLDEIDDQATKPADLLDVSSNSKRVRITLGYPYWNTGTLPLTMKTEPLFPTSPYNPVLIEFVDGRNGDTFDGWVTAEQGYVSGLKNWYVQNDIPVGAYLTLQQGESPTQLVIEYQAIRGQRDWTRQATVNGGRLNFRMNPASVNVKYDDLMLVSAADEAKVAQLAEQYRSRNVSLADTVRHVFPELAKLSPQSTVHAKTLYTGVNMLRRTAPGPLFQVLVDEASFVPMQNGYWSYDPQ